MCSVCGFEGISSVGDWSNGMIGVSKTFGGSSILSSPVFLSVGSIDFTLLSTFFIYENNSTLYRSSVLDLGDNYHLIYLYKNTPFHMQ